MKLLSLPPPPYHTFVPKLTLSNHLPYHTFASTHVPYPTHLPSTHFPCPTPPFQLITLTIHLPYPTHFLESDDSALVVRSQGLGSGCEA